MRNHTTTDAFFTRAGAALRAVTGAAAMVLAIAAFAPGTAGAQGKGHGKKVPPGHLPRAGQCRVWYDGTPPGHQPPPTSCAEARRDAYYRGGRVIYGGGTYGGDRYDRRDRDDRYDRRDRDDRARDGYCYERDGRHDPDCGYYPDRRYPDDRYPGAGYPTSLPDMVWGIIFGRGQARSDVRRWVGATDVRPRYADVDRNGRPEVVSWYTPNGRLVQRWIDDNRDGRADRVALYDGRRVVRVIR